MFNSDPLFAYFSPETLLPVGSILATVLGVAMMLGRGSSAFLDAFLQASLTAVRMDRGSEPASLSAE